MLKVIWEDEGLIIKSPLFITKATKDIEGNILNDDLDLPLEKIKGEVFEDFPPKLKLSFNTWDDFEVVSWISFYKNDNEEVFWSLGGRLTDVVALKWNLNELGSNVLRILESNYGKGRVFYHSDEPGDFPFEIREISLDAFGSLYENANSLNEEINSLVKSGLDSLKSSCNLSIYFTFDDDIKHCCKQYLLYFGQLLEDSGIPNSTSVIEELTGFRLEVRYDVSLYAQEKMKKLVSFFVAAPGSLQSLTPHINNETPMNDLIDAIKYLNRQLERRLGNRYIENINAGTQNPGTEIIQGIQRVVIEDKLETKAEFFNGYLKLGKVKLKRLGIEFELGKLLSNLFDKSK